MSDSESSLVIGVDPGLQASGVVLAKISFRGEAEIMSWEEIKTKGAWLLSRRIAYIYAHIKKIINKTHPEIMAIEKIYSHYRHPYTASLLAHARGVIILAAEEVGVKIVEFSNTHIKKAVLGRGNSSAVQLRKMAAYLAGRDIPFSSQHLTDALALVLAFAHTKKVGLKYL